MSNSVRQLSPRVRFALLSSAVLLITAGVVTQIFFARRAQAVSTNVVISQVYGGGGNSGAPYKNDFIELFNRGTSTINLSGWSVQYSSSANTAGWTVTNLTGSIAPGGYYLVQQAGGATGASLPTADATGTTNMNATNGKVALVNSITPLSGGCPSGAAIVDLVGYGTNTAACFEGTAVGALSNTAAAIRKGGGCQDTDNNSSDFNVATPTPRNTTSPTNPCTPTNNPPTITAPANPIATKNQDDPPFTVSLTGNDDGSVYSWGATAGTGISSVTVSGGQGTANVTYTVTLQPGFNGTASFTASLSDTVNTPATTRLVNIAVNAPVIVDNPPTITAPANPIATVTRDDAPFTVALSGSDDHNIFNWSATPGSGLSSVIVTSGQGTANVTYTVTLQSGFTGTATFTASLSDNVNTAATQTVNITVNPPTPLNHIVISQVYGGGGNSLATYQNDYVELYNPTASAVDVGGWTIQYASATGTGDWLVQPLGGIIQPGEYYLISLATNGAVGLPLPAANISGSINMSGTTGKVALSNNGDALTGCPTADPTLVDLVGYGGTANCREGGSNAPTPSNTTAIFRKNGGATDTNVNGADFVVGTPSPRRTAAITEIGPYVLSVDPRSNSTSGPHDASITVNFTEAVDVVGSWYNINCANTGSHNDATVAHTGDFKTYVITPNANFQFSEQCTVTVFATAVHDQDLDDSAPGTDTLKADYVWSFTVVLDNQSPPPYPPSVHLTMGNPTNAVADIDQPNNYLMEKPTYVLSYNRDKGTPNWVSWYLTSEWYGSLSRLDTFRPDPAVPSDWYRVQAFDYFTTGFDRGHMTPNADRDNQNRVPINQETFLMSNMVPQAPDNNQGPWANLENYLRTLTDAGSEIYIVSGPAGVGGIGSNSPSSVTNTIADGHVTVPAYTWKVALVLPQGSDDISRVTCSTRAIAVIMPNTQGIRTTNPNDWQTYLTTVDAVEQLTGYDLYSNLPPAVQACVEAGTNGVNPPGTANQLADTAEDNAVTITLQALQANSNPLAFQIMSTPTSGSLGSIGSVSCSAGTCTANVTYTPSADFNGSDSFTFRANDGSVHSNTSTVNIGVSEVNDSPSAVDDIKNTQEDTPLTFSAADLIANDSTGPSNESGQTLNVTAVNATTNTHGTVGLASGSITYSPDANYNGSASFTYTVCDNGTTNGSPDWKCTTATVNVDVEAVNDNPTAVDDAATTDEDTPITISVLGNDSDVDGDSLTVSGVTQGAHGVVTNNGTNASYSPASNFNGNDSFTYTVSDGHGGTATATVNVTINAVNDNPVAVSDSASTNEDNSVTIDVVANDTDVDGDSLSLASVGTASHGSVSIVSGKAVYSPVPNYNGSDSFAYVVSDGHGGQANGVANVTVNPVNDAPTANSQSANTNSNIPVAITLTGSDVETPPGSLTFTVTSGPSHGLLSGTGANRTYTPAFNYSGPDSFQFTVTDTGDGSSPTLTSSAATVSITVNDTVGPTITLTNNSISLWPANHTYHTINVSDLVASASDNFDPNVTLNSVVITQATSDEIENGNGDGNTLNDVVIASDCKSVQLRAERDGSGDGRVYTITFLVRDAAGNTTIATGKVIVPKNSGGNAVDSGPHYTVNSTCH